MMATPKSFGVILRAPPGQHKLPELRGMIDGQFPTPYGDCHWPELISHEGKVYRVTSASSGGMRIYEEQLVTPVRLVTEKKTPEKGE